MRRVKRFGIGMLTMAALLLFAGTALAQTGKIVGQVLDDQGNPIVGANVILKGTRIGAASDLDGTYFMVNIPLGSYDVTASAVGYQSVTINDVQVQVERTTQLNFTLKMSAVKMEDVVVTYKKPPIQVDQTFKLQSLKSDEMRTMPVNDVSQVVTLQAGVTKKIQTSPVNSQPVFGQFATVPTDGFHFRGGREGEAMYLYDGIPVRDDLWGGFEVDAISGEGIEDISVYSGTFGPEYGEAMSGVMAFNPLSRELNHYRWYISGLTDRVGGTPGPNGGSDNTWQGEATLSGPVPAIKNMTFLLTNRYYTTDGYLYGYIYPNYVDSEGTDKSGTPEEVPMQYRDQSFTTGKLLYFPTDHIRVSVGGFYGKSQNGLYNHYFKYNPYGTPRVQLNQNLSYIKYNQGVSDRTYFNIAVSRFDRIFHSGVWNNPTDYAVIPQNGTGEFSISGEDWVYFDSRFLRNGVEGKISSQVNDQNLVSVGGSYDMALTQLTRLNPDGFMPIEDYRFHPVKAAGYVQDKMEFNSIGMILNIGLRGDYVDPDRNFPANIHNTQDTTTVEKVNPSSYFSPRLGVSYPISDKAAFHFGYGHYYQFPNFYKVYQGTNDNYHGGRIPNIQSVSGAIAVGNIKEEKTINYEAGVQTRISSVVTLGVTGFYRKTSNLIGTLIIEDKNGTRFPALDNIDYATVKGVEVTLRRQFTDFFGAFLNYTYSQTKVSSSLLFQQPTDITRTFLADWDQPHVVSGSLTFHFPQDWGFTLNGSASSGFPYTFNTFAPNEERGPMLMNLDLFAYKDFGFGGFSQRVYLQVLNLPNRKNVWWVYSDSGRPGEDANPATSYDYTNNPAMWGPGRRIQVGVSLWAD